MREPLVNGYKSGVYLQPTRSDQCCVHSFDWISEGSVAVSLNSQNYIVWLSVDAVDNLALNIEQYDFSDGEYGDEIGRTEQIHSKYAETQTNVKYSRSRGGDCIVCTDSISWQSDCIKFTNPRDTTNIVKIHTECVYTFLEGLEQVWDYPEHVLPERI